MNIVPTESPARLNPSRPIPWGPRLELRPVFAGVLALTGAMLATGLVASPAHGVPPANDQITSATRITAIPSTFQQDTTEATGSRADGDCVGGRSVWYRYRSSTTKTARFTTIGTDFDSMLTVFKGPRDAKQLIRCNDDDVSRWEATQVRLLAGTTYWIAVSSCCSHGATSGGHAELRVYRPTTPQIDADPVSAQSGGISGRLYVGVALSCATPSTYELYVAASQRQGTMVANGEGGAYGTCLPGESSTVRVRIDPATQLAFNPGSQVLLDVNAFAYDGFSGVDVQDTATLPVTDDPTARVAGSRQGA